MQYLYVIHLISSNGQWFRRENGAFLRHLSQHALIFHFSPLRMCIHFSRISSARSVIVYRLSGYFRQMARLMERRAVYRKWACVCVCVCVASCGWHKIMMPPKSNNSEQWATDKHTHLKTHVRAPAKPPINIGCRCCARACGTVSSPHHSSSEHKAFHQVFIVDSRRTLRTFYMIRPIWRAGEEWKCLYVYTCVGYFNSIPLLGEHYGQIVL